MKKILIILSIIISILCIYLFTRDKNLFYLNISDTENPYTIYINDYINKKNRLEKYINNFSSDDYRITALTNDINNNKTIYINGKKQTLKNALVKADIITMSIGNTDLYYKINYYDVNEMYNYIDNMLIDYEVLLKTIRKITKEKIVILGYTSPDPKYDDLISYLNTKLDEIAKNYNINFVYVDSNTNENLKKILNSLLK